MNRKLKNLLICFLFIIAVGHSFAQAQNSGDGRLFIRTAPEGARIRILSIKPKFHQGILLKPGPHQIEISADGYATKNIWITIEPGDERNLGISLNRLLSPPSGNPDELVSLGIGHQ